MSFWTNEQIELLVKHYPDMPMPELTELIGRKIHSIYNKAFSLNIHRSEAFRNSPHACRLRRGDNVGAEFRFKKGQTPPNKGMKGVYYEGSVATFFPKCHKPANYKPVGTIRTIRDSVDGYQEIKMAEGMRQWKLLHRVVWERMNGPIPANHIVIFLDGNVKNINIKNLAVISRKDNALRNSHYNNYPKEISQLIQLRGAVNRQINKRIKNEQHANA